MQCFNDLGDFEQDELAALLELARVLDEAPEPTALQGKVLSLLFLSPSLRTLASFQSAMSRLGGGVFVISPEMSIHHLESRTGIVMDGTAAEHIREAIPVIAAYSHAIGIRAFAERQDLESDLHDTTFRELAALVDIPYINMESAIAHPCQSLADWKTMDDINIPMHGGRFVLSWTWHPQPMPLAVPAASVQMAALRGMDVTVLRPEGYDLPDMIMERAHTAAQCSGGTIRETDDVTEAMENAHILYANSWCSTRFYGDKLGEEDFKDELRHWRVEDAWFDNADPQCRFMHCLPVRREVTVSESVLDGRRSIVIPEARNRMLVQMAILHQMLA